MSILSPNSHVLCAEIQLPELRPHRLSRRSAGSGANWLVFDASKNECRKRNMRGCYAFWPEVSKKPAAVEEMEPIQDCEHFDQILEQAKELSKPIVVDWMAAWCRKCIYLKPKLEKLAAEYDDKLKFYSVDVNKVPQALVKRANVSKMPTIQIWKDGEMKAEVIGGHKAWLVIEEVRDMIQKFV